MVLLIILERIEKIKFNLAYAVYLHLFRKIYFSRLLFIMPHTIIINMKFEFLFQSILKSAKHNWTIDINHNVYQQKLLQLACVPLLPMEMMRTGMAIVLDIVPGSEMSRKISNIARNFEREHVQLWTTRSCYRDYSCFDDGARDHCVTLQNRFLRKPEVSFWEYFRHSLVIAEDGWADILKARQHGNMTRTNKVTCIVGKEDRRNKQPLKPMKILWDMLDREEIGIMNFLEDAPKILTPFFRDLAFNFAASFSTPAPRNNVLRINVPRINAPRHLIQVSDTEDESSDDEDDVDPQRQPVLPVMNPVVPEIQPVAMQVDEPQDDAQERKITLKCQRQNCARRANHISRSCGHLLFCRQCVCGIMDEHRRAVKSLIDAELLCPLCSMATGGFRNIHVQDSGGENIMLF